METDSTAKNRSQDMGDHFNTRVQRGENLLGFGIDYLDDALYGISRSDVILVGAESGAGKTQLVTNIALHNVAQKKQVHYFALEADDMEIEDRICYQLFIENLKADKIFSWPEYQDFAHGRHKYPVQDLQTQNQFKQDFKGLHTLYKEGDYTVDKFTASYADSVARGAELIIVDHAHYFDWGEKSDYVGLREVVTTARDMALISNVPCILVSHMRKTDQFNACYAPAIEDFHGTSELYKRATKALTMGKGSYDPTSGLGETFINVVKQRFNGQVTRVTGKLHFNYNKTTYERGYEIGRANQKRGKEFEIFEQDVIPKWCKKYGFSRNNFKNVSTKPKVAAQQGRAKHIQALPYKDN